VLPNEETPLSPNQVDKMSKLSRRSGLSVRSARAGLNSKTLDSIPKKDNVETILEHPNEG
jgi:hypothetical protein